MPKSVVKLSMMYTELPFFRPFRGGFAAVEHLFQQAFGKAKTASPLKARGSTHQQFKY